MIPSGSVSFYAPDGAPLGGTICEPQLNLLAHAQILELEIGSRCGGHGVCGGDRVQIRSRAGALNPLQEAEREHLSDEEIDAGWRLACQAFPEQAESAIDVQIASAP